MHFEIIILNKFFGDDQEKKKLLKQTMAVTSLISHQVECDITGTGNTMGNSVIRD